MNAKRHWRAAEPQQQQISITEYNVYRILWIKYALTSHISNTL
jgi:hypothetical protein